MRPSEINAKKDKATAWMVTIIIHAALLAALLFVGMPSKTAPSSTKQATEHQVVQSQTKPKA